MHPKTLIAVAAILTLVMSGLPTEAVAAPGATVVEDWQIAEAYWGRPVTRCSEIVFSDGVERDTAVAEATLTYPGYDAACEVRIRSGLSGQYLCDVVAHEYGHLLGEADDPEAANPIEIPGASSWEPSVVPACQAPQPIYAPAAEPRAAPRPHDHRHWRAFRRGEDIPVPAHM